MLSITDTINGRALHYRHHLHSHIHASANTDTPHIHTYTHLSDTYTNTYTPHIHPPIHTHTDKHWHKSTKENHIWRDNSSTWFLNSTFYLMRPDVLKFHVLFDAPRCSSELVTAPPLGGPTVLSDLWLATVVPLRVMCLSSDWLGACCPCWPAVVSFLTDQWRFKWDGNRWISLSQTINHPACSNLWCKTPLECV